MKGNKCGSSKEWCLTVDDYLVNGAQHYDGTSNYFLGGVITYSNKIKEELLSVNSKTIEKYGAVSQQVALEMVNGINLLTNSQLINADINNDNLVDILDVVTLVNLILSE